ncbi:hypothetical protein B0H19DRAFT_1077476 [Mycena capillaripes]|nr:hypothetical protein B0H19DRAFT_1077476 [Mycena capillaripes]
MTRWSVGLLDTNALWISHIHRRNSVHHKAGLGERRRVAWSSRSKKVEDKSRRSHCADHGHTSATTFGFNQILDFYFYDLLLTRSYGLLRELCCTFGPQKQINPHGALRLGYVFQLTVRDTSPASPKPRLPPSKSAAMGWTAAEFVCCDRSMLGDQEARQESKDHRFGVSVQSPFTRGMATIGGHAPFSNHRCLTEAGFK